MPITARSFLKCSAPMPAGRTNALRQAFQLVAMIISIALTPVVTSAIGYGLTAILYGILGGAVILYMSFTSQEVPVTEEDIKPKLWESLKDLLLNKKFWISGLANAFYSAAMSLVMAALPFFVKYTLKFQPGNRPFYSPPADRAIGCVSVWAWLVRKFTLIPVWRAALAALGLAFIPLYFANSLVTAIVGRLVGFGFAA